MSKVTVEVVADTRPFLRSIAKLRRIAAQLNNSNYKNSTKLLKNLFANHKLNEKITREVQKQNQEYAKSGKLISSNVATLGKLALVGATIKSIISTGYRAGESIFNAAATYGGNPNEVVRARGLITRGGGRPEEGESLYSQFMQNRMLFAKYQEGGFKKAAGRFGVDPRVLMTENIGDLIENLRKLSKARGYDSFTKQAILQEIGLGGNPAIMNLLNMSNEEYAKNVAEVNEELEKSKVEWEQQLRAQQEWNKAMDSFKRQLMLLTQAIVPLLEAFNKLPTPLRTVSLALGPLAVGSLFKGGSKLGSAALGLGGKILGRAGAAVSGVLGGTTLGTAALVTAIIAGLTTFFHDAYKQIVGKEGDAWTYKIIDSLVDALTDPDKRKEEQARRNEAFRQTEEYKRHLTVTIESGDSVGREVGNVLYDNLQMSPINDVNLR